MSVYKKFVGDTAIYGVSTIVSRLLYFILTPVYTIKFPPVVYSVFTSMYSWVSLINAFLAFGMETTYFRYMNKHSDRKQEVYNNAFLTTLFFASVFLFTGLLFSGKIVTWLSRADANTIADYTLYVKFFLCILFIDALSVVPFAKIRADGKPMRFALIRLVNISVMIGLNLFFIFVIPYIIQHNWFIAGLFKSWYRGQWIGYVFFSNLMASIATLLLLLPEVMKVQFVVSRQLLKDMFYYSWPILVANISFIINENIDKIFLDRMLPPDKLSDVGIYGACAKIAIFMSIFNQAFRLGAEPFFFSHAKNENAKRTYALILNYFVIALALIFVGLVSNIEILKYFIGPKYWTGLGVIPLLLFGYVCLGIYMNLSVWYRLSDQTRYGLYISGVGAALTIVLNILLIPKYGYVGSAWVSMFAYFVMMVLSYVLGQKHYPIPYNLKKVIFYITLSLVLVILSFWVFKRNIWIGNALFIAFISFTYMLEKDNIKKLLKRS